MIVDLSALSKWVFPVFRFAFKPIPQRYIVASGGRGSGKSFHLCGLNSVYKSFKIDGNILVVQKTYSNIKDATFANITGAISALGLTEQFNILKSPFEITNKLNGNKILFRGLDNAEKLKSIERIRTVIIEEADQLTQRDFEVLDLSIRGSDDINIFLLFNPVSPFCFIKTEYMDKNREDTLLHHSTYEDNPYLGKSFYAEMERLKKENYGRYKIDGLGEFGTPEGLVFPNFEIRDFDYSQFDLFEGIDWGWTHPFFHLKVAVSEREKIIYVCEEFAGSQIPDEQIISHLKSNSKGLIYADSAEAKTIANYKSKGINIKAVDKSKMTVEEQIRVLQGYKIVSHSQCKLFNTQAYLYKYPDNGLKDTPVKMNDDGYDCLRYALFSWFTPVSKIKGYRS